MRYSWEGDELGSGHLTLTSASLESGVGFDLVFGVTEGEGDLATGELTYADVDGGVDVTWTFAGEMTGLLDPWFGLFMDSLAGPEFERGLTGLKERSEKGLGTRLKEGASEVLREIIK